MNEPRQKLPEKFGRYEVTGQIGVGGMGVVLRAHDPKLGRDVAIKAILSHLETAPTVAERFRREAMTLAKLSHPNIVRVFDAGEEHGILYYVMELLQGRGLDSRVDAVREGSLAVPPPFDPKEFFDLFTPLAEALSVVHRHGIIHRDIKPANILAGVPERGAVLTDFGLTLVTDDEKLTRHGHIVGTPRYMAPEQVSGVEATPVADVYSFGATMFEFLTGHVPFENIRGASLVAARMAARLPPVASLAPEVPGPVAETIDRCVVLEPGERIQSTREVFRLLQDAREELRVPAGRAGRRSSPAHAPARPSSQSARSAARASAEAVSDASAASGDSLTQDLPERLASRLIPALAVLGVAAIAGAAGVLWLTRPAPVASPPMVPASSQPSSVVTTPTAGRAEAPERGAPLRAPPFSLKRPSLDTPLLLTRGEDRSRRAAMAALEGDLITAWVRESGEIGVAVGDQGGRVWSESPLDAKLRANPESDLALASRGGRVHLFFCRTDAEGTPRLYTSAAAQSASTWGPAVELGVVGSPGAGIALAAHPSAAAADTLVAAWRAPGDRGLLVSWGTADGSAWTRPSGPSYDQQVRQFCLTATPRGAAMLVWHVRLEDTEYLRTSSCPGPGMPWTPVSKFETPGLDPVAPIACMTAERTYLAWNEQQKFIKPIMLAVSTRGEEFQILGRAWPHTREHLNAIAAEGNRMWVVSWEDLQRRLAWSRSFDGGMSWQRQEVLPVVVKRSEIVDLELTVFEKVAWLLWTDQEGRVQLVTLP